MIAAILGFGLAVLAAASGRATSIVFVALAILVSFLASTLPAAPTPLALMHFGLVLVTYNLGLAAWLGWQALQQNGSAKPAR